jgi:hypothetical protein
MEKTMLWEAFSTLSRAELRECEYFVDTPFFNRKKQVGRLFQYLRTVLEQSGAPRAEAAFEAAFPDEKAFDDQKMRLAMSDLLALIERFWLLEGGEEERARKKVRLSKIFRGRNLDKQARIALREAQEALPQIPFRNLDFFEHRIQVETEAYHVASATKRFEDFNLQAISDLVDQHFVARKLRHTCIMLSHQAVFKKEYDLGLYPLILEYVEKKGWTGEAAISLYYHACRFLEGHSPDHHFQEFRKGLVEQGDLFPREEQLALFLLAINFAVKKINVVGQHWYGETLQLYKTALERELLFKDGQISRFAYNNIVTIAIRTQEVDWADTFLHQYRPFLERKYREASFSLNAARVAYVKKDYGIALLHLQKADYKDFINSLNAKTLQIKIYFEQGEPELLESHLDSMQNYIRRQRAVGYHRENYLNMVKYTRALIRLSAAAERKNLREQIEQAQPLTEREWLLSMLEERPKPTNAEAATR